MKKLKLGLVGITKNPVKAHRSHNAGQTFVIKKVIESKYGEECLILNQNDDWDECDILFVTEGVNFIPGNFNLYGGVDKNIITRLTKLHNFKGKVLSVCGSLDYNLLIKQRSALKGFDFKFDKMENFNPYKVNGKLALGDSHILSAYKPGYGLSKNNAKTLRGFLKVGLKNYIPDHVKDLLFYAGNIDVRFLAFNPNRKESYTEFIDETLRRLETQLIGLDLEKVTCVKLIPIEDPSRKIPKADQIDGLNFFGTFEQRQLAVKYFNEELEKMCIKNNFNVIGWDFDYSEPLDFDFMEAKQSVHIRPSSYLHSKNTKNIF